MPDDVRFPWAITTIQERAFNIMYLSVTIVPNHLAMETCLWYVGPWTMPMASTSRLMLTVAINIDNVLVCDPELVIFHHTSCTSVTYSHELRYWRWCFILTPNVIMFCVCIATNPDYQCCKLSSKEVNRIISEHINTLLLLILPILKRNN